jgi:hypothetical protein
VNFADIGLHVPSLLMPSPKVDLRAWTVVACDQYTSQPEYWKRVEALVAARPSTLNMILPEVYLGAADVAQREQRIVKSMEQYLRDGTLAPCGPGFVRVERTLANGTTRKGLVVALDLESYDFRPASAALIRASEGTVVERLPPRVRIREQALLELPHVMVLIDDPERTVIEPLWSLQLKSIYDFELMEGAGRLKGDLVERPEHLEAVASALRTLAQPQLFAEKYGVRGEPVLLYAMGDGNHSFATAKLVWEKTSARLTPQQRKDHPARYALVELVNVHDEGLVFGPIHRIVNGMGPEDLLGQMRTYFEQNGSSCSWKMHGSWEAVQRQMRTAATRSAHRVPFRAAKRCGVLTIDTPRAALAAGSLQAFFDYLRGRGAKFELDFIHGEAALHELASRDNAVGFELSVISKHDLFRTVILDGALPRKAFSMGHADDKRFYLECRRIVA